MEFKISVHCGQINTFLMKDFEDKDAALEYMREQAKENLFRFGDLLINPAQIAFITVEEVQPVKVEEGVADVEVVS